MYKKIINILLCIFTFNVVLCQQTKVKDVPVIQLKKAISTITIDADLNEEAWKHANLAKDFVQQFPFDTSLAKTKTEVKILYDDYYLYISAVCYDTLPGEFIVQSLKRDFAPKVNDAFCIYIDPFNDLTNGFAFCISPHGVQSEGLLQYGGGMGINYTWDNKWLSEVKIFDRYWIAEIAIPFKTLRYNKQLQTWRINFARTDLKRNELSVWSPVPRNFNASSLAFTGLLIWDEPIKKSVTNISLIPYLINTYTENYQPQNNYLNKPNAGLDAKVGIGPGLNLDLTINPDFAQVEVDRQVTNLSRFSLFFPERRNFFIENSDIFERFGFRQIRPFFSRRIGLINGNNIPIIAGARLSGKLNRKWRIGVMNMQTEKKAEFNVDAENFTAAAALYQLKGRSNIAAIFVNKQTFEKDKINFNNFNRVAGLDWNIASMDGKINGKIFYHHAFLNKKADDNFAHASWLMYEDPQWTLMWNHEYVGRNYDAQVGFVPRVDNYNPVLDTIIKKSYWRFEPMITRKFYPNSKIINNHGPNFYLSEYRNGQFNLTERYASASYRINYQNTAHTEFTFAYNNILLFFDTDITFSGNKLLPAGYYQYNNIKIAHTSNQRKKFNYSLYADYGNYYIGKKTTYQADVNYRLQPWGIFSISVQNNILSMPDDYKDVNLWLIAPGIDLSFTKNLFFTTFLQYNTQINNTNINTRIQWRFKPMSDLFIVYTENYNSQNISVKNRAVAIKLVWWFNL
jgi:hypothetical protein